MARARGSPPSLVAPSRNTGTPPTRLTRVTLGAAVDHLAASDPLIAAIVARRGVPPLWARPQGFLTLLKIILEQQVSLAAAATVYARLIAFAGGDTPDAVAAVGPERLHAFGLTRQKSRYVHELATRVADGRLRLPALARETDDTVRARLIALPGIGPWSADIYLLMALRRPDVWPQGDLALALQLRDTLGLPATPSRAAQLALAERWRPWRSVAARVVWLEYLRARGR